MEHAAREQDNPPPAEKPERIAPHRDGAAAAHGGERDHGKARAERQQRYDATVESVGIMVPLAFGERYGLCRLARPDERRRNEQGRQREKNLTGREQRWMA